MEEGNIDIPESHVEAYVDVEKDRVREYGVSYTFLHNDDGDEFFPMRKYWEKLKDKITIYNRYDHEFHFVEELSIAEDQNVYKVSDGTQEWVAKWDKEQKGRKLHTEEEEYQKLRKVGAQVPATLPGYFVMGIPVLLIEFLEPLDFTDDPSEVGRQLLTTQLRYIHTYAVHVDLKPDNVRKKTSPDGRTLYYIIDMDLSSVREGPGFLREHATPMYTSQRLFDRTDPPITSYRADLVELGYVMTQLHLARNYVHRLGIFDGEEFTRKRELPKMGFPNGVEPADLDRMMKKYGTHPENTQLYLAMHDMIRRKVRDPDSVDFLYEYRKEVKKLPEWVAPTDFSDWEDLPNGNYKNVYEALAELLHSAYRSKKYKKRTEQSTLFCFKCNRRAAMGNCSECRARYMCRRCFERHECNN